MWYICGAWLYRAKISRARPGFVVSPNGLTRGAAEAIRSGARDDLLIVPLTRADLDAVTKGGKPILDWLEEALSKPV